MLKPIWFLAREIYLRRELNNPSRVFHLLFIPFQLAILFDRSVSFRVFIAFNCMGDLHMCDFIYRYSTRSEFEALTIKLHKIENQILELIE